MLFTLEGLQKQQLIQINDGAIVSWPVGASKPKTSQLSKSVTTGAGALGGAFWGFLFGLLFFVPIFGPAVGAAIGALMGHFANYGIDQSFIDQVRQDHPGHLSLVPVVEWAVTDRVAEAVKGQQFEIIQTNLSKGSCKNPCPTSYLLRTSAEMKGPLIVVEAYSSSHREKHC